MSSALHLILKIKSSYSIFFIAITLFLCSVNPGLAKTPITNDFLQSIYDQHGNFFVKPNQNSIRQYEDIFIRFYDDVDTLNNNVINAFQYGSQINPQHILDIYKIAAKKIGYLGEQNYLNNIGFLDEILYQELSRITGIDYLNESLIINEDLTFIENENNTQVYDDIENETVSFEDEVFNFDELSIENVFSSAQLSPLAIGDRKSVV